MKRYLKKSSRKAFTIIEVVIVLAITGLIFIGLIVGLGTLVSRQRAYDTTQQAYDYLRQQVSNLATLTSMEDNSKAEELCLRGVWGVRSDSVTIDDVRSLCSVYGLAITVSGDGTRITTSQLIGANYETYQAYKQNLAARNSGTLTGEDKELVDNANINYMSISNIFPVDNGCMASEIISTKDLPWDGRIELDGLANYVDGEASNFGYRDDKKPLVSLANTSFASSDLAEGEQQGSTPASMEESNYEAYMILMYRHPESGEMVYDQVFIPEGDEYLSIEDINAGDMTKCSETEAVLYYTWEHMPSEAIGWRGVDFEPSFEICITSDDIRRTIRDYRYIHLKSGNSGEAMFELLDADGDVAEYRDSYYLGGENNNNYKELERDIMGYLPNGARKASAVVADDNTSDEPQLSLDGKCYAGKGEKDDHYPKSK